MATGRVRLTIRARNSFRVPWWTRLRWRAETAWAWFRRDVLPVDLRCTTCDGRGWFFAMGDEYTCSCPDGEAYGAPPPDDLDWVELGPLDDSIWHKILGWVLSSLLALLIVLLVVVLIAVSGAAG